MPLMNKLLTSRKIIKKNTDYKLPVNFEIGTSNRHSLRFGADQVRVLLFRECEWRGRKLLFDSVTAGKNNGTLPQKSNAESTECPRNANGLPQEHEKEACDNVNLLSELVFGTVAMTYRGPLFKIHTLDSPRCIMCTKVFPAPDHNVHRQIGKQSEDNLGNAINIESNSSNGSTRNTLSCPSSGNFSGSSLRKSSTCSSSCSGWDIDMAPLGSSQQSLASSTSSGFGSFSSLRRRWLRAVSTSLNQSESDEIFGFQPYSDHSGDIFDYNHRRHKTRLGLSVIIKLTPGQEGLMEVRLLEHAAQLEAILNRLCYICIVKNGNQFQKNEDNSKGLVQRLHKASFRCTLWLLRLLVTSEGTTSLLIWHDILLNSTICTEVRKNMLHRNFQQMCHLLSTIDTKSTNFFLSTVVTAVLTYHLGWVNTVMSPQERTWLESMKKKYPCNPLWTQLGDLYGTLGNPPKLVHTVITGDSEKSSLINSILTFLSYFIRSALVEKHYEYRSSAEAEVQEAIKILEAKRKKCNSTPMTLGPNRGSKMCRLKTNLINEPGSSLKKQLESGETEDLQNINDCKRLGDKDIPRFKKSSSMSRNLDLSAPKLLKPENEFPLKLNLYHEDLDDLEKDNSQSSVKIIVSSEKNIPRTSTLDEFEPKFDWRDPEMDMKMNFLQSQWADSGFDSMKFVASGFEETEVYYSQVELNDDKQNQVHFTLGGEDKTNDPIPTELTNTCSCESSFAFTRVPSTSSQLPEGVLRKILQRNFPESSKSIQRPSGTSVSRERPFGSCPKCNGSGNYEGHNGKLLLETPTNATEVLRTCGNSVSARGARVRRVDSLEELLEANDFIELPMPRSTHISSVTKDMKESTGFTSTLLRRQVSEPDKNFILKDSGYMSGLVIQGLIKQRGKRKKSKSNRKISSDEEDGDTSWLSKLKEEVGINARFPMIDQSISEALCILADIDNWQVGVISNNTPTQTSSPPPVGMSRLVSDMLEAFVYLWTKYRSPVHCLNVLECKLREMLLRSESLAEFLLTIDACDVNLANLASALDLDAADVPLLLAVATTHSPQIAHRFGLSFT